ncbi:MAG: PLP-dependent aminotransferase family protein, partial [Dehalococcoidia bacterium]
MSREYFWTANRIDEIASSRARTLGPSVWAAAQPDGKRLISFAGGLPDIPSLPGEELERAARKVIATDRKEALEYGGTFGTLPLRQELARRSTRLEGLQIDPEQVLIVSGSAHGIGLMCETLLDPGDTVLVESPNFPGSIRTIRAFGPEIVPVPLDEEGLRVDHLEATLDRLLNEGRRPKFLYCIPTHQNPAGVTLPLARREKLLELVRRFETLIIEDDAYGELWFDSPPPPSMFALSGGDHVVKISSFSKILATGLRMGWSMGPPALISRMAATRYDMGSSVFLG